MLKIAVDKANVQFEAGGTEKDIAIDATMVVMSAARAVAQSSGVSKEFALVMITKAAMDNISKSKDPEEITHIVFPVSDRKEGEEC